MPARNELKMPTSTAKAGSLARGGYSVFMSRPLKGQMVHSARDQKRALTVRLMEKICQRKNLNQAYKRVVQNGGAPGVDGMRVEDLKAWAKAHKDSLIHSLLDGTYRPQPVKHVSIPKSGGGERQLGIPTVVDRLVQQAILQVVGSILEPEFSHHSYGFRRGRSGHQALKQAQQYVQEGYTYVVDMDIEQFFDRVNHDMIMARLARYIGDKRLLKVIRRFLESGILDGEAYIQRHEGMPQGGPLSPILSNLLLTDLDRELEKRGHRFCRYADDCNIYVKSKQAAERVLNSVSRFIEERLKLKVNRTKSAADSVNKRRFLGYVIRSRGTLVACQSSLTKLKGKVCQLTRRNRGMNVEKIVQELNQSLRGWIAFFKLDGRTSVYQDLDSWIRRRLRCYRLKQRKRNSSIAKWLIQMGLEKKHAWQLAASSKGWWRLSKTIQLHMVLSNAWFAELGLISIHKERVRLNS